MGAYHSNAVSTSSKLDVTKSSIENAISSLLLAGQCLVTTEGSLTQIIHEDLSNEINELENIKNTVASIQGEISAIALKIENERLEEARKKQEAQTLEVEEKWME